jgi:hypothetical protein
MKKTWLSWSSGEVLGIPTGVLADQMLSSGLEAYASSVDLSKLPSHFA